MITFLVFLLCLSDSGVVIVDGVLFYGDDHKMRCFNTGDVVEIVEQIEDTVIVKRDSAVGPILNDVIVNFKEIIAEEHLFVFARGYFDEGEYKKSAKLLNLFIKNFDGSRYCAEALYYYGLSREELAGSFDKSDSTPDFLFNEKYNIWYYSGEAYMEILERFSESTYASKAVYRLINIFRMRNLPWNDSVQLIQEELRMWQDFDSKYKNTDEYVLVLLEIGYLNRVLFEITEDLDYRTDAVKIFQEIFDTYPNSIYSAQSRLNLHEIKNGKNIYKY